MNARRKSLHPSAALLAAVEAGDVTTIRSLLGTGIYPAVAYKNKLPVIEAFCSGQEALARPFLEAIREFSSPASTLNLNFLVSRVFADDRFSVSFAAEFASDMRPELNSEGLTAQGLWGALLEHGPETGHTGHPIVPRDPATLAGKVRLAIRLGWRPEEAWHLGWLPHHSYVAAGFIEAAVMCVVAGFANPDEPLRREGLQPPEIFEAWPAFQAALRAHRSNEVPFPFPSTNRTRQRA